MGILEIIMSLLVVVSTLATIGMIHRKRQPITPTVAVWTVIINTLLVIALLN